ncbi:MAG: chorismate mutase [Oscillospiraceae bacterium]|nr:chorismate mutase [Oscillospiraceae bacterium]
MVRAIRGAVTVENNDKDEILDAVKTLLEKIISDNNAAKEDMVSIIFTLTPDLNAVFPARAARDLGFSDVPLMCMSEIPVDGALEKCIRVMLTLNTDKSLAEIKHVYLKGAVALRPDLAG